MKITFKLSKRHLAYAVALFTIIATIIISIIIIFINRSPEQPQTVTLAIKQVRSNNTKKAVKPQAISQKNSSKPNPIEEENVIDNEFENLFGGEETKARLAQIRDAYAEDINYPSFSKPIRSEKALYKYLPNESVASSNAIGLEDTNSPTISIKPSKYRYFKGEDILAEAIIRGLGVGRDSSVSGRLIKNGKIIAVPEVIQSENNDPQYSLHFNDLSSIDMGEQASLRIVAEFIIEGKLFEIGTPVMYLNSIAKLDHIEPAQVQGEYLQIPVYISTTEIGFHQISGNLYNAETGQPILHLSAKKKLNTEYDFIPLKAHIASLKVMGHEGPYELKDISLIRMPSPPDFRTAHGYIEQDSFIIEDFPFSDYLDVPYVNERALRRLDFLTKLGKNKKKETSPD